MSGKIMHGALKVLLRAQSAICPRIFPKRSKSCENREYIFGQNELGKERLYLAKAKYTACEVIAVYNALVNSGLPGSFLEVRKAFFRRGALALWPLGFFGGNPYSIGRVLSAFGAAYKRTADISADGKYILSFFNGPENPSIHTVFAVYESGKFRVYNLYASDRAPRLADLKSQERLIITAYYIGEAS